MDAQDRHDELTGTSFARELRCQFETLAQTVGASERRHRRRRRFIFIAVTILGAGIALGGATLAGAFDSLSHRPEPRMVYADEPGTPTPYATNAAGQTYGGAQEGPEADLQSVGAHRGENGYCWKTDLDGPFPINHDEIEWLWAVQGRREVAVYKSDGVTQVGLFIVGGGYYQSVSADGTSVMKKAPNRLAEQPPAWLFTLLKTTAVDAGDANAWAWWRVTTLGEAASATEATVDETDSSRPAYLAVILGDFTRWLWSPSEGVKAPEFSWIYEIIDAGSREVLSSGASAKPFQKAASRQMNILGLRDRITWAPSP